MKPRLFVGSSVDDLLIASALAALIEKDVDVLTWTEDVFTLSASVLSGLQQSIGSADLALFVATPLGASGKELSSNLIVELGICVGLLGAQRTAVVFEGRMSSDFPSDVRDLTYFVFPKTRRADDLRKSLRSTARKIRDWARLVGPRSDRSLALVSPGAVVSPSPSVTKERARVTSDIKARSGVFISYSHKDARWLERIRIMLTPLVRTQEIFVWDDTKIKPGTKWKQEIANAIDGAQVALLLVSPNFLASGFVADKELPPILNASREKGLVVIWALVSACLYKKTPIAEYQAAHSTARPLDSLTLPRRNEALLAIAEAISAAVEPTTVGT